MGRRRPGAGSVELRGESFELRYVREDGKRTRKVLGRADEITREEALRRSDDLLFALRGSPAPGTDLTAARLVETLLPVLRSFLAPATVRCIAATGGMCARFFGARPARTIDIPAAQDFMASLAGRKANTVRKYRADLLALWKLGHERGMLGPANPWRSVRVPRAVEPAVRPVPREDVEAIAPLVGPEIADLLRFLCETGLRCGEANRLVQSDVRDGRVYVRQSKSGRPRGFRLSALAVSILASVRLRGRRERVFGGLLDGKGYDRVRTRILRACEEANVARVTLHGCRHRCACDLAEAGCSERDIAAVLGHTDEKVTRRYTRDLHPDAAGDRAVDRLERHRASSRKLAE